QVDSHRGPGHNEVAVAAKEIEANFSKQENDDDLAGQKFGIGQKAREPLLHWRKEFHSEKRHKNLTEHTQAEQKKQCRQNPEISSRYRVARGGGFHSQSLNIHW